MNVRQQGDSTPYPVLTLRDCTLRGCVVVYSGSSCSSSTAYIVSIAVSMQHLWLLGLASKLSNYKFNYGGSLPTKVSHTHAASFTRQWLIFTGHSSRQL